MHSQISATEVLLDTWITFYQQALPDTTRD